VIRETEENLGQLDRRVKLGRVLLTELAI